MKHVHFVFTAVAALGWLALSQGSASAQYPQFPVYRTPPVVTGVTPWGGPYTHTQTYFNSAYDPYRGMSRQWGPHQPVNRPLYDPYGRVVGWESGTRWFNPVTRVWHSDIQQMTPTGSGGVLIDGRTEQGR